MIQPSIEVTPNVVRRKSRKALNSKRKRLLMMMHSSVLTKILPIRPKKRLRRMMLMEKQ